MNIEERIKNAVAINYKGEDYEVRATDEDEQIMYVKDEDEEPESFTFDELREAYEKNDFEAYDLVNMDYIHHEYSTIAVYLLGKYPSAEVFKYHEALERWSVLSKFEEKSLQDSLKLRCLNQPDDAVGIITRATRQEHINRKKVVIATQLLSATVNHYPVVFYEVCEGQHRGGQYGLETHEYVSFPL